jgi:hypothetical protein
MIQISADTDQDVTSNDSQLFHSVTDIIMPEYYTHAQSSFRPHHSAHRPRPPTSQSHSSWSTSADPPPTPTPIVTNHPPTYHTRSESSSTHRPIPPRRGAVPALATDQRIPLERGTRPLIVSAVNAVGMGVDGRDRGWGLRVGGAVRGTGGLEDGNASGRYDDADGEEVRVGTSKGVGVGSCVGMLVGGEEVGWT